MSLGLRTLGSQNNVKKEGWVLKKSKHMKKYHKRFMQLKGTKLLCFVNIQFGKSRDKPTEVFDFLTHQYRIETHDTVNKKFYLIDESISQSRTFKTISELDRQIWVYKIRTVISSIQKMTPLKNKALNQNIRKTRGLSITATFESEASNSNIAVYDSDSDGSDDEAIVPQTRKRTMSKRKMDVTISRDSFRNFRIRSLTVDSQVLPDFNDSDEEDDVYGNDNKETEYSLLSLATGRGDDFNQIYDVMDTAVVEEKKDDGIIDQLKVFGYDRNQIVAAMKTVTNSTDINEIRDKLDSESESAKEEKDEMEQRKQRKRFVEQEMVSSEQAYCQGLHTLLNELMQPMFDNEFIDQKYYKQIRSSLPKLLEFHKDFLCHFAYFADENTEHKAIANVFKDYIFENRKTFIDINIEYIKDYQKICSLFGCEFHGNVKLDEFLKNKRKEMKPLSSFLMLPIQRIERYNYFLTHLKKSTEEKSEDYKDINEAFEMMKGITKEIHESKEKIENLAQTLQIQEGLNGLDASIVHENRRFLQQFIFIKKSIKHQRLFFVFNDVLLIANGKWKVKKILPMLTLEIKIETEKNIGKTVKSKKENLAEFRLIAVGIGSSTYVGKDLKTVNKLQKLIGKWRVKIMTEDLRNRLSTLGSLREELGRQEELYD